MATPTATTPLLSSRASSQSLHRLLNRRRRARQNSILHFLPIIFPVLLFAAVAFLAWDVSSFGNCYFQPLCRLLGDGRGVEEGWWRNQGPYAPYRRMGKGGAVVGLPRGCEVDQVTLLHRHTARYPTTSAGKCMLSGLGKIKNREVRVSRHHPELSFLNKADLDLENWYFDGLMDQGRKAAWDSGYHISGAYRKFLEQAEGVFTRSAGGERIVETSGYWLEGFRRHRFSRKELPKLPEVDLVIPEGSSYNNTLSVHSCPAFESLSPSPGEEAQAELYPLLQPALDRLNSVLRPVPRLEMEELVCLADMCGYDSQVRGLSWDGWSKWCAVFDQDEWEVMGYMKDVKRFYEVGQGSDLGATMGAGYVNEVIARLTDSVPVDRTITNRTLNEDEATFPRGGQRFFVDFGHDNEMLETLAALGVLKQHRPLTTSEVPLKRTFILSHIVPFGARLTFERVSCDTNNWGINPPDEEPETRKEGTKSFVRILVNDKIQPVIHSACEQSALAEHGLCELDAFIESQYFAREGVDWGVCYADDKN
ncbi:hypothetical protein I350_08137 [Cryptococcus amylolentus CBS 6273]|uniref:Phytase n=1 Tax=Cryptococcus amylolentus CBS 6273 TaxID=1296118 RepID=A0A1E3J8H5_9TREE|nr:hypothetical protein I350_08137 [Cryptococcus amylolentus CBS 6273]